MLIDSHCHLTYKDYDVDLENVLKRARDVDIRRFITVGTSLDEIQQLHILADKYKDIFCSIGVHPCHIEDRSIIDEEVISACNHPKVIAIGETGLDYSFNINRKKQNEAFDLQVEVANSIDLPVIVHSRDAEMDMLYFLRKIKRGVLHCFTGSYDFACKAIDLGFYISFSGILTFKKAEDLRKTARKLPMDSLLLETDAPFLSPEPKRKIKRNEPALMYYTACVLAELKKLPVEEIGEVTTKNCFNLFSKIE